MGKMANQIRRAIRKSGLSLNQLAEETGVDDGVLSRFMRDERSITLETAEKLADYLGLELHERSRKRS